MKPAGSARLHALDVESTTARYGPAETIFAQGDRCAAVMYVEAGSVALTVTSQLGHEAVVATLRAGTFFGEGALTGQRRRTTAAKSLGPATITQVRTAEMRRALNQQHALAQWFRTHMLATNIRLEAKLVDQMFNRTEKRLARMLLLLANFDVHQRPYSALPKISRRVLADAIGTSRWNVDRLMTRFRRLGFLERRAERDGGLQVHRSMVSVVLQE